jgi:hypothetical protein
MRFKEYLMEDTSSSMRLSMEFERADMNFFAEKQRETKEILNIINSQLTNKFDCVIETEITNAFVRLRIPLNSASLARQAMAIKDTCQEILNEREEGFYGAIDGFVNCQGVPKFRLDYNEIIIRISKQQTLNKIDEVIINPDFVSVSFDKNWIGGLLKLCDIKNINTNRFSLCIENDAGGNSSGGLQKALDNVMNELLKPNPDKWNLQEELEKDKATKPYASE